MPLLRVTSGLPTSALCACRLLRYRLTARWRRQPITIGQFIIRRMGIAIRATRTRIGRRWGPGSNGHQRAWGLPITHACGYADRGQPCRKGHPCPQSPAILAAGARLHHGHQKRSRARRDRAPKLQRRSPWSALFRLHQEFHERTRRTHRDCAAHSHERRHYLARHQTVILHMRSYPGSESHDACPTRSSGSEPNDACLP